MNLQYKRNLWASKQEPRSSPKKEGYIVSDSHIIPDLQFCQKNYKIFLTDEFQDRGRLVSSCMTGNVAGSFFRSPSSSPHSLNVWGQRDSAYMLIFGNDRPGDLCQHQQPDEAQRSSKGKHTATSPICLTSGDHYYWLQL